MRLRIKEARDRIELLRLALVSPSAADLGAALPGLEQAATSLGEIEKELRAGGPAPYEVRRELQMLKNDLRIIARLVEHGMAFCRGWAKMLGAGPGYTQAGRTAPIRSEGRLSLRG
jgi:hypothetical protein